MAPTATVDPSSPSVVNTTLNYYLDPNLGGHTSFQPGKASYYRRKFDKRPAEIHDMRGQEEKFSLRKSGFQLCKHTSVEKEFDDEGKVKGAVYEEAARLLKEVIGATRVHVFSHITRRDNPEKTAAAVAKLPNDANVTEVIPAQFIHIDQSTVGAYEVLRDNLPDDADRLSKTRWSIINVWRPIRPVRKDPVAVCDARSVKDENLIPIRAILPREESGLQYGTLTKGKGFEAFYLKWSGEEEWWYVSEMTPDEVLLIKCFDTIRDGETATRVPHTAFRDPATKDLSGTRESIEIRSLVFYEDQEI